MNRIVFALVCLSFTSGFAWAGTSAPVPGPLLGAVGGPWGFVAAAGVYGAYRWFKAKR